MSLLDAITSAFGEEIGKLRGNLMTRLTAPTLLERQIRRATGTMSSADGLTCTLGVGTFGPSMVPGAIIRLLSGAFVGHQGVVSIVNSTISVTLLTTLGGAFSNQSWEAVLPADDTVSVESTLYFTDTGEFFLGGVKHRYTGRTPTQLTGVSYWDGTAWFAGVGVALDIGAVLTDYGRTRTAIDLLRRSFFVETAQDIELTDLGGQAGRDRRPGMEDPELYRAWLRAVMYSPWGTKLGIWQILDAIIGVGNWETFFDFTSSTDDLAKLYIRRTDESLTDLRGRWILDGSTRVVASNATHVTIADTPLVVGSVRLASDSSARLVASGTSASTTNGVNITGPAAQFASIIRKGDRFEVLSGPLIGQFGAVLTRTSDTALILGTMPGAGESILTGAATKFSWRITREVTNGRFVLPSADTALDFDSDTGTTAWDWQGTETEVNGGLLIAGSDTAVGVPSPDVGLTGYYRHLARIVPESRASLTLIAYPVSLASTIDGRGASFEIHDGTKNISVGFINDAISGIWVQLQSAGAVVVGNATVHLPTQTNFRTWTLEKRGKGMVVLSLDGREIISAEYSTFAASALHQIRIGCVGTATTGFQHVREISWRAETDTDYWAGQVSGAAATGVTHPQRLSSLSGFVTVGNVGKTIWVSGATARNAGGGTVNGEWEIQTRIDANTADVIGRTKAGASFSRLIPHCIILPDDYALSVPDALGHSIELLTGPAAGVYPIARFLGKVRPFNPIEGTILASSELFDISPSPTLLEQSVVAEVTGYPVGGFSGEGLFDWRIVPSFAADSGLTVQFSSPDAASFTGPVLTLPQSLPITSPLPVLEVDYATVYSGHTEAEEDKNDVTTPRKPAYLYDAWGIRRPFVLEGGAEGIVLDLDSLSRDAAGLHVQED